MEQRRKNLTQLFIPICLEKSLYIYNGQFENLILKTVKDQG